MANAANKTQPTQAMVEAFLATVDNQQRRDDAVRLLDLFARVTGEPPVMWGDSIIGYGSYDYRYDSGREGRFMRTGFSPRKANLSVYLMGAYVDPAAEARQEELLARLGKHKRGKSCLYLNRLDQVDMVVLEELVRLNVETMNRRYPPEAASDTPLAHLAERAQPRFCLGHIVAGKRQGVAALGELQLVIA